MLVGDADRDRVVATLREHYAGGRLTLEEFSSRSDLALSARSRVDLWTALAGLSVAPFADDLVRQGRVLARAAARGAAVVVFTGAYVLFSIALLLVLGLTVLIHGTSDAALLGFLVVWLVPTYLLSRLWHGGRPRRRPGL
jgi:hypothetical protein